MGIQKISTLIDYKKLQKIRVELGFVAVVIVKERATNHG